MDPVTSAFITTMVELVFKYGVPGTIAVFQAWNVKDPTVADIEALKNIKPPADYFTTTNKP